ncbi:MAG: hypothetical protein DLM60_23590 [Pseudonocardiales bacterium]|nr:MAG: hypothetical protein DLM60_23590 [Pseudonocardiales bacterium]
MNHKTHLYLMGGLLAAGAVLFFWGGAGTGLFLFVWLGACMAMMFFMMRGMGGMGGKGSDASGHSHGADLPKDFEDQSRRR